tara:strand:- start:384 stop:1421 length:1038 start_codon:yes stop_codon:yes gene_type:complete
MNNKNIESIKKLVTPYELKNNLNLKYDERVFIEESRLEINKIINGGSSKKLIIVGPCSIHNYDECIDYALKLKKMISEFDNLYIVIRIYLEKPRTIAGWKGFLYDPELNESNNIMLGLEKSRKLLIEITKMRIPIATEFLDTIIPQYIDDLISWGCIGARTVESQLHRQLASGLSMSIGFKNRTDGDVMVAINGMLSSKNPHAFLGIDINGCSSIINTSGNNNSCIVLRGGGGNKNLDKNSLESIIKMCKKNKCNQNLILDISHDNSLVNNKKIFKEQINNIDYLCSILNNKNDLSVVGIMIESNINEGNQKISKSMKYGVSITDGCISLEDTYICLKKLNKSII